jgi:L-lactate dehydrogenase
VKIGVVGSGAVGATAAYALVMRGVGSEIVLVDKAEKKARAEAADILHAVPFAHPLQVRSGGYPDLAGCRVVIVAAGVGQKPGETRLELLGRNAAVFRAVVPEVFRTAPDAILVVATNPVDVMTHVAARYAADFGVPSHRILGSGTTLDTARFRALLGQHLEVDSTHVHAYVLGEHGDSEVLAWSTATIGTIPLGRFCELRGFSLDDEKRASIDVAVRRAAYHIIEGKGATFYGVGSALARIVSNILWDRRSIMTVCAPRPEVAGVRNVTVSLPSLVGGEGIEGTFTQPLSADEDEALHASAAVIRRAIDDLDRAG